MYRKTGSIAMYLRLSKMDEEEYDESNSISNQRGLIQSYLEKEESINSYHVREYCDDGYTGLSLERPGIQRLLADVKQGVIWCIIVKDISRFSRDYITLGDYLEHIFPFMGVRFIAINDNYDSVKARNRTIPMDIQFKSLLNEMYSRDCSIKIKSSFEARLAEGEYIFHHLPLGYRKSEVEKNKVVIDEREAKIFRRIVDLSMCGMSAASIARLFHSEGVPTFAQLRNVRPRNGRTDATWTSHYILKLLRNPFYIGDMVYGKTYRPEIGKPKPKLTPKREQKLIHNHHVPLMTMEEWNVLSKSRRIHNAAKAENVRHPLSGKLFCGGCGRRMYAVEHARYFTCKYTWVLGEGCCKGIREDFLSELVLYRLNIELQAKADLEKQQKYLIECLEKTVKQLKVEEKSMQNTLKEEEGNFLKLYEQYAKGLITKKQYSEEKQRLSQSHEEQKQQLANNNTRQQEVEMKLEETKKNLLNVLRYIGSTDLTDEIVKTFISRVTVYPDKRVDIAWAFSEMKHEKFR